MDRRFRGFSPETRRFLQALEAEPCASEWPGEERVTYAAHVLSPLKALVSDLERALADVTPRLGLEARVGASLSWSWDTPPASADCPVRQLRIWDASRPVHESPLLYLELSARALEIGLDSAGAEEAVARVRSALAVPGSELGAAAARLESSGWHADAGARGGNGDSAAAEGPGVDRGDRTHLPDGWAGPTIRIRRELSWEQWTNEPAFASELADRFRELLPVFDVMRGAVPPAARPRPLEGASRPRPR